MIILFISESVNGRFNRASVWDCIAYIYIYLRPFCLAYNFDRINTTIQFLLI